VSEYAMVTAGFQTDVAALAGPLLLRGVGRTNGSLGDHRRLWPEPVQDTGRGTADELVAQLRRARIYGRGGAEFPFWRKLQTALDSGRRRELVVNASEGEPASAKDSTLLTAVPHLVLDGAQLVAEALDVQLVYLVVPGERPAVLDTVRRAIAERSRGRNRLIFEVRSTTGGFVGGQSRALLELLSGRENLPVTSRKPEAISGLRGKPTLLSNAETFAQIAALSAVGQDRYAAIGTADEPGTRLLTVAGDGPGGVVLEVPHGTAMADVLRLCGYDSSQPVLVGGYHGSWLSAEQARLSTISPTGLRAFEARLGAGALLPLLPGDCPVIYTAQIVAYLAQRRAKRCGPCTRGLPALAEACQQLASTRAAFDPRSVLRVRELCGLVIGRGACAHPDGTARLVVSMLTTFGPEVAAHQQNTCLFRSHPAMV
jgi:NADH:ubiquinone oxidoreductase subunit F (NADH-binding)